MSSKRYREHKGYMAIEVTDDDLDVCTVCALHRTKKCESAACLPIHRKDGKDVYFVRNEDVHGLVYVLEHREGREMNTCVMGVYSGRGKAVAEIRSLEETKGWFAVYPQRIDHGYILAPSSLEFFDVSGKKLREQPIP